VKPNLKTIAKYIEKGDYDGLVIELACLKEKLQQPPKISRRIKQWLVNNENLPLITKIEMVISLYNKEILGDATSEG